jgi:hypothetical protein
MKTRPQDADSTHCVKSRFIHAVETTLKQGFCTCCYVRVIVQLFHMQGVPIPGKSKRTRRITLPSFHYFAVTKGLILHLHVTSLLLLSTIPIIMAAQRHLVKLKNGEVKTPILLRLHVTRPTLPSHHTHLRGGTAPSCDGSQDGAVPL